MTAFGLLRQATDTQPHATARDGLDVPEWDLVHPYALHVELVDTIRCDKAPTSVMPDVLIGR